MKINLTNIEVKNLDGEVRAFDISKNFANYIYQRTVDLGMLDVAQEIYKKGEVEINEDQQKEIVTLINLPECPFIAMIKRQLLNLMEDE